MSNKLTIFVCGTYRDLVEEREAVLDAIRKLQYQHDSMEYFGARPNLPIETCLDEVRKSDVLVVIVGHTYGSLVPELNISYSEAEYQEGHKLGKPCLVYMKDENVPVLPKFMEEDPEKIKLLRNFRKTLNDRHTAGKFRGPNDLAVSIAADISRIAQSLEHLVSESNDPINVLKHGAEAWNIWRAKRPATYLDLINVDLQRCNLKGANLSDTNLSEANLSECDLREVNFSNAVLTNASLIKANLAGANFRRSNLSHTNLSGADLSRTSLIETIVEGAVISESTVYGINVWDLQGEFKEQRNLLVTPEGITKIKVDSIETASLVYLLLNSRAVRDIINTLTSYAVLILGRFALPERKRILDTLKSSLRDQNLIPLVFDFERPIDKDFTETIRTLVGLSAFVIVDVTNPKSAPLELQATVPDYQIPFVPIIQEGEVPFAMMVDFQKKYNWVLNTVTYDSEETLIKVLKPLIIDPAMKKRQELRITKAYEPEIISAKDYLDKGNK